MNSSRDGPKASSREAGRSRGPTWHACLGGEGVLDCHESVRAVADGRVGPRGVVRAAGADAAGVDGHAGEKGHCREEGGEA